MIRNKDSRNQCHHLLKFRLTCRYQLNIFLSFCTRKDMCSNFFIKKNRSWLHIFNFDGCEKAKPQFASQ